jgi:ABC-type dipeptide/oligopeptide/nickel transport system permease component
MAKFILQRVLIAIPLMLVVSVLVFIIIFIQKRPPTAAQMAISIELAGLISPGLMMPTCGT